MHPLPADPTRSDPRHIDPVVMDETLPRLVLRTLRQERSRYRVKPGPLSLPRLWKTVVPNLRQPIFVIGSPRSGTTFLGECVSVLPEISYHHEPIATKAAARHVYERDWSFRRAKHFYRQVYAWLMRVHFDGHRRFAEKTPRNCFLVSFLRRAFRDAQFLHIVRDGRDAALSHSERPWLQAAAAGSGRREPGGYLYGPSSQFWVERERRQEFERTSDLHRCIWAWRRYTESVLAERKQLLPEQYLAVRYEALVTHGDEEAEKILDFLEITDPASRSLFFEALARGRPDSVGRWRAELASANLALIEGEAGPLLDALGYPV